MERDVENLGRDVDELNERVLVLEAQEGRLDKLRRRVEDIEEQVMALQLEILGWKRTIADRILGEKTRILGEETEK